MKTENINLSIKLLQIEKKITKLFMEFFDDMKKNEKNNINSHYNKESFKI